MKALIIDNYDSFTYILKQYFGQLGAGPEVFFNDQITIDEIRKINPTHIVLSPGPGTVEEPKDVGITFEVIEAFKGEMPMLGVCLGHQAIGKAFGGNIVRAPEVVHGKRSWIHHDEAGIFEGVKSPFEAMRYHSLMVDDVKSPLEVTARTSEDLVMALAHESLPIFGVQFHPESLGTPEGMKILKNFLNQ